MPSALFFCHHCLSVIIIDSPVSHQSLTVSAICDFARLQSNSKQRCNASNASYFTTCRHTSQSLMPDHAHLPSPPPQTIPIQIYIIAVS